MNLRKTTMAAVVCGLAGAGMVLPITTANASIYTDPTMTSGTCTAPTSVTLSDFTTGGGAGIAITCTDANGDPLIPIVTTTSTLLGYNGWNDTNADGTPNGYLSNNLYNAPSPLGPGLDDFASAASPFKAGVSDGWYFFGHSLLRFDATGQSIDPATNPCSYKTSYSYFAVDASGAIRTTVGHFSVTDPTNACSGVVASNPTTATPTPTVTTTTPTPTPTTTTVTPTPTPTTTTVTPTPTTTTVTPTPTPTVTTTTPTPTPTVTTTTPTTTTVTPTPTPTVTTTTPTPTPTDVQPTASGNVMVTGSFMSDNNNNGIMDGPDTGLANQTIVATATDGSVAATTTTDTAGQWSFTLDALKPGTNYTVSAALPVGRVWVQNTSDDYVAGQTTVDGMTDSKVSFAVEGQDIGTPPTPISPNPPTRTPVIKVTRSFQVDKYSWNTNWAGTKVAAHDDDGYLGYREDAWMWKSAYGRTHTKSSYQFVTVTLPKTSTPAQWMAAVNAKTSSLVGDVATTNKVSTLRPTGSVTVAWEVMPGATPVAGGLAWGPNHNISQKFFARS